MEKNFLIDTNVIIEFSAGNFSGPAFKTLSVIIDNGPIISIINKIKVLGFTDVSPEIEEFINIAEVIKLDDSIAEMTIALRKKYRIKLPDAIIAATAIYSDATLITCNEKDFKSVKGLKIMNPKKLPS